MRVRTVMALAGLALVLVARPAQATSDRVAVLPDGTYSHSVYAALAQQQAEKNDSVKTPPVVLLAGGAALGLAGIFVLGSGDHPALGGGLPASGPGGVTIPPQTQYSPPLPTTPFGGTPGGTPGPTLNPPTFTPTDHMPGTTAPEPVSMALLATGLAGMGGASLMRRRRR